MKTLLLATVAIAAFGYMLGPQTGYAAETTLYSFSGTDGSVPAAGLFADAAGNLFGTTAYGGSSSYGTVFELKNNGGGSYTQSTLLSFNNADGATPYAGVVADASGNLFGTTTGGGTSSYGTVFELKNNGGGSYTSTTLHSFTDSGADGGGPEAGLLADASGNLFGTTEYGGTSYDGTVFELKNNGGLYTTTTLYSFSGTDGRRPYGGVIADAAGNLFGTTYAGGPADIGTVFELKNNGGGSYTQSTLLDLNGATGYYPLSGLVADAAGDLFGTGNIGGANTDGAVFELKNNGGSYTPITLYSFTGTGVDGSRPYAGLLVDAAGNLFGTTREGGANGDGTVFELKNDGGGSYTPTTLFSFNRTDGLSPTGGLLADSAGNLFGTTAAGGASNDGTVFEITNSGFATSVPEPRSLALLATGLTGLLLGRWRKRS